MFLDYLNVDVKNNIFLNKIFNFYIFLNILNCSH